ncbi:MAG: ABC transporter ATP-binding protein [Oscillospiraceae bacterium]|nr:ABC transporter ATP-binding protein [Oscillospiraceae bacterium]
MIGEVLIDLFQPKLMSSIVDEGVLAGNMELIISTGIKMLILVFFGGLCGVGSAAFSGMAAQNFGCDLRNDVFRRVTALSFEQTDKFTTGSLVTRLTNDISAVQQFVDMLLRMFIRSFMLFGGGIFMMLSLDVSFGLVLVCSLPVEVIIMAVLLKKASPIFGQVQVKLDAVNNVVQENVGGARVVKAYVREDYESKRFGKANDDLMNTNLKVQRIMATLNPMLSIVLNISVVAVIYIGGLQVEAANIAGTGTGVGEVMAAVTYVTQIMMSMMMCSNMFQSVSRAKASADRIVEILETVPVISDGEGDSEPEENTGAVTFKGVCFRYPDASGNPVLNGISVDIKKGERFAILGATGSGKSSLVNLIPRFYDVTEGAVLVDGIDVRDCKLEELRDKVGMVLQKSELFSGTVEENIRWGLKEASEEDVERAAIIAQADEFISKMPDGYKSMISEKGASLSGGQKQRLSIARAILKKPEILIFDDSTSALDLGTEARLQEALKSELKGTTVIKIAQRIASVRSCDRIAVLENGMFSAVGTHDELMLNSDVYRDIYNSQQNAEKEVD